MGNPMDIHSATIANPSTLGSNGLDNNAVPTTKEELLELINQKDILEGELRALGAVLDSVCTLLLCFRF